MRSKPRAATLVIRAGLLAVLMGFFLVGLVVAAFAPSRPSDELLVASANAKTPERTTLGADADRSREAQQPSESK